MWEKETPCIAAFPGGYKHDTPVNNYFWTQLAQRYSRPHPPSELLQYVREKYNPTIRIASQCEGKIQSQHQNCFKMWGHMKPPPQIYCLQERYNTWQTTKQIHMNTTGPKAQQNAPIIKIASRWEREKQIPPSELLQDVRKRNPLHSCFPGEVYMTPH